MFVHGKFDRVRHVLNPESQQYSVSLALIALNGTGPEPVQDIKKDK